MRIIAAILSLAFLPVLAQAATGQEKRFADATETNEQLMDLYEQAGAYAARENTREFAARMRGALG